MDRKTRRAAWLLGALLTLPAMGALGQTFTDIGAGLVGLEDGGVAWGDYDGDGDLDIAAAGDSDGSEFSLIYRNDGGVFTDIGAPLAPADDNASVAWGDYDNDGDLDLLLTGDEDDRGPVSLVYRNDAGTFTEVDVGLLGVSDGMGVWADFDNDGDLDVLLMGEDGTFENATAIYRNDGGVFTDAEADLPALDDNSHGSWGDYDNDGDLDLLLAGDDDDIGDVTALYRNDAGVFVDVDAGLIPMDDGMSAWGDYDNDGDLDIVIAGDTNDGTDTTLIYRNDDGVFQDIGAGLFGVNDDGSVAWGDYDNDGDLDILLAGDDDNNVEVAIVYRNDGGFFGDIGAAIEASDDSAAIWGDYDADGDLDVLLMGDPPVGPDATRVYRSDGAPANTPPAAPTSLRASGSDTELLLTWAPASDLETPPPSLTYNVRVGTTPGGSEILSAMSDAETGFRHLPAMGNANHSTVLPLRGLEHGTYYWSVQSVDTAFAGSPFAAEGSVTLPGVETAVPLDPGWTLLSLPAPALDDELSALTEAGVDTAMRWDAVGQAYELLEVDALGFVSDGYFVHRDSSLQAVSQPLSLALDAAEAASVAMSIEPGWNLVGAPTGGIPVGDITPYPNTVFEWDGAGYNAASLLAPFRGYWVFNPSDAYTVEAAQLRHRVDAAGSAMPHRPARPDWSGAVTLLLDDGRRRVAYVGASEAASRGFDEMDVPQPPPSPRHDEPGLWIIGEGPARRLTRSVVPVRDGATEWVAIVDTAEGGIVTADIGGLPEGYRVALASGAAGASDGGRLRVPAGRHAFRVTIWRDAHAVTRLLANYPSPFNPDTWIPFELRDAAEVNVTIYDVSGRVVRRLAVGYREAGYYTRRDEAVHWDGRNTAGESVSSGAYIYEMRAGDTRRMRRLVVGK
ncbi:hypothetical protein HN371_29870 [Candidatus Poribacteria bacterium]|jgi:hypothetical protein|nr:hypothetical protein [Candidatus Poribacteria bacterium]MBT5715141.1 hypothetical protein [Candidatus Poribacteria bacterium]MBT7098858.1 hypothetical protein [Candidatus Poribacteria bacterium]MBT7807398.1 hypothetical protein [Candidatus Poribacteria bacterium]